jgi:hypothetical protein
MGTRWQVYPKYQRPSQLVREIVAVFEAAQPTIGTKANPRPQKKSNQVLAAVADGLRAIGFEVENQPAVASEEEEEEEEGKGSCRLLGTRAPVTQIPDPAYVRTSDGTYTRGDCPASPG